MGDGRLRSGQWRRRLGPRIRIQRVERDGSTLRRIIRRVFGVGDAAGCSGERPLPPRRSRRPGVGSRGLAYDAAHDILYVANSADGTIYQIAHAASSTSTQPATPFLTDTAHLHGPLELAFLPNGHFVVANSDGTNIDPNQPSELVEYTAQGAFVNQMSIDPNNGAAFGLAIENIGWGTVRLAAVNDNANSVMIRTLVVQ